MVPVKPIWRNAMKCLLILVLCFVGLAGCTTTEMIDSQVAVTKEIVVFTVAIDGTASFGRLPRGRMARNRKEIYFVVNS